MNAELGMVKTIRVAPGVEPWTKDAKQMVTRAMYEKGKSFLGAALLLRKQGGSEYVVLHLLCQGIEITLKALLLMLKYNDYKSQLKKGPFGHNLEHLVNTAIREFGVRPISTALSTELKQLNALYSRHRLRYGTMFDILVEGRTIASNATVRKIAAVIRLANRHLTKSL